jgi:hypothetical protein
MNRFVAALLLLTTCGVLTTFGQKTDDTPAKKDAPAKKDDPAATDKDKDKDKKPAAEFNSPPKGVAIIKLGTVHGVIAKGSDGKTFRLKIDKQEKDVEVNLASTTKVRIPANEFDDKGNRKKPKYDPKDTDRSLGGVKGTSDDIKDGEKVLVDLSGTRDAKWLMAKIVIVEP